MDAGRAVQPFLHELVTCVRAPVAVLGGADGQIRADGAQGLHWLDARHLSELVLTVDDVEPTPVGWSLRGPSSARFVGVVRGLGTDIADPTVRVERQRTATGAGMVEVIDVVNDGREPVAATVTLRAAVDLAPITEVKHGGRRAALRPTPGRAGASWRTGASGTDLRVLAEDQPASLRVTSTGDAVVLTWPVRLESRASVSVQLEVSLTDERSAQWFRPVPTAPWSEPLRVTSASPGLDALVARAADDVAALLLADGGDVFAAAGSPWFLTLFGRDSIWAARFLLPLGCELAGGTLRALARRQASVDDAISSAQPGKIPHEVRLAPMQFGEVHVPPTYYGSIDATPLWISLLHDAWSWGMEEAAVESLLDPLERAVTWMLRQRNDAGLLAYSDESGHGLANQGWKDSGDSIQDARGVLATPPIALCEVQAYACRALLDAARLLDAFGRPGSGVAREAAADISAAFRRHFWVERGGSCFPAVALDGRGCPVDSLTSNIGHLLGTGLLDAGEERAVADLLARPGLSDGYGVRTLDRAHPHFNPLGYHSGSVWPHDSAITVLALARAGHAAAAWRIAAGIVDAAASFDARLPELFGGWPRAEGAPLAYPAACRPQAWSAAVGVAVLTAVTGLTVDVPSGRVDAQPDPAFGALFPLTVTGVRVGASILDIDVDRDGRADVRLR